MTKYNLRNLTLREKQSTFVLMVRDLITFATQSGYEFTFGDAWAHNGHKKDSNHYIRLAIDLNLFKDGKWITDGEDFVPLHDYWDSIGGAQRIIHDMNHFSVEHQGRW